jgi:hypothetical protein
LVIKNGRKYFQKWLRNKDFLFEIYRKKGLARTFRLPIYFQKVLDNSCNVMGIDTQQLDTLLRRVISLSWQVVANWRIACIEIMIIPSAQSDEIVVK